MKNRTFLLLICLHDWFLLHSHVYVDNQKCSQISNCNWDPVLSHHCLIQNISDAIFISIGFPNNSPE
ncbi:hypothetical protein KC19_6G094100 [Ceratodon purpureus]|uniref:Uncharacterized protein n=1 Tax=Ceratodon purpureus TaxID=3225 RepID=A0A8T0HH46_CERPU|nr:hypothetical protein KC19_6G094100 [Ceratodon purpureus]